MHTRNVFLQYYFIFFSLQNQFLDPNNPLCFQIKKLFEEANLFSLVTKMIQITRILALAMHECVGVCTYNHCTNCQGREKWITDLWQFAQKQDGKYWQFAPLFVRPWHIAAAARYAKGLCAICQSRGSRRRVLTKSAGSGEPVFKTNGCATVQTIALKWSIFKQAKGCATISLDLNYGTTSWTHLNHHCVSL
jgi:hypothetical protein